MCLKNLLDKCNFILSAITPGISKNDFVNDETLKRTVVRSLKVIGETKKYRGLQTPVF